MKAACAYAVVQFRPFVETGEFANVGIVLLGVEHRFFDFQLLRKYSRVTRFFPELDRKVYLEAIAGFREELDRIKGFVRREALDRRRKSADKAMAERVFIELTRTREGLLRFDNPRLIMTDDPQSKLEGLFEHYVGRNFATKEYQERLLENKVGRLLYKARLPFGEGKIGNDDFVVRFPFIHRDSDEVTGVIKPLFLGQTDTTSLLTKGDNWVSKVKRLRRINKLPRHVLFALDAPPHDSERRFKAFQEISREFIDLGVCVTEASNDREILSFATNTLSVIA